MTKTAFDELMLFVSEQMRMSHIYQPVMLKVLLENGGRASRKTIRQATTTTMLTVFSVISRPKG